MPTKSRRCSCYDDLVPDANILVERFGIGSYRVDETMDDRCRRDVFIGMLLTIVYVLNFLTVCPITLKSYVSDCIEGEF